MSQDDFNSTIVREATDKRKEEAFKHWPGTDQEKIEILQGTKPVPIVAVIDDELALESLGSNILILEDPFRTGFECKGCDGEGHTDKPCPNCHGNKVVAQNPEFDANAAVLSEAELKLLPPHFAETLRKKRTEQDENRIVSGGLVPCTKCICTDGRGGKEISGHEICRVCQGAGASIVVPETSMNRPTTGKIVAVGENCHRLRVGERVCYSNMIGNAINFKHKAVFRIMREDECFLRLHGTKPENFQKKLK